MRTVFDYLYSIRDIQDKGLYFALSGSHCKFVPYSVLYEKALRLGQWLVDSGVGTGQELILSVSDPEEYIYTFWGCVLYGIVPAPVLIDPTKGDNLNLLLDICHHQNVLVDQEDTYRWLGDPDFDKSIRCRLLYPRQGVENGSSVGLAPGDICRWDDDVVCILFSSGSTSDPKGVGIKNKAFASEIVSLSRRLDVDSNDSVLNWMTLNHVYALTAAHLLSVYHGLDQYHMSSSVFMKDPVLWLEYIHKYRCSITYATNFSLNYVTRLCRGSKDRIKGWDLSCASIVVSAEPLSTDVFSEFCQQMQEYGLDANALIPAYGITEGTAAVSIGKKGAPLKILELDKESMQLYSPVKFAQENCIRTLSNGSPLENVEVCIVDAEGKQLTDGSLGLICIRGKTVIDSYYNRGDTAGTHGWFQTGDIGFLYSGEVYVTSRYKLMFFVGSKNYYAGDLEYHVVQQGICQQGSVWFVGYRKHHNDVNDSVLCFIQGQANKERAQMAAGITQTIQQNFALVIELVVPLGDIPKTDNGKIQRYKMLVNYQNGQYDRDIAKMNQYLPQAESEDLSEEETEALADILAVFSQRLGFALHRDDNYIQIGISSVDLTFIYMKLEQKYKQLVSAAELYEFQTPARLAEYIEKNKL